MTIILVIALIVMAGLLILERERLKNLEAQSQLEREKLTELEKQNRGLDIRLKMLSKMNGELEQKLAALEGEKAEIQEKLKASEARLKQIQASTEAMTPDDIVQTTRRILQDSGVEKIDVGARFSLSAFRKNTRILLEWEEFSLARIPALEKKAEVLEKKNLNLQNQVLLWKEAERLWKQKNTIWIEERTILNRLVLNYEKQLQAHRRRQWIYVALGILAGAGGHALLK